MTFQLVSETDWLVYADFLQEQNEPFKETEVREPPAINSWDYEYACHSAAVSPTCRLIPELMIQVISIYYQVGGGLPTVGVMCDVGSIRDISGEPL